LSAGDFSFSFLVHTLWISSTFLFFSLRFCLLHFISFGLIVSALFLAFSFGLVSPSFHFFWFHLISFHVANVDVEDSASCAARRQPARRCRLEQGLARDVPLAGNSSNLNYPNLISIDAPTDRCAHRSSPRCPASAHQICKGIGKTRRFATSGDPS